MTRPDRHINNYNEDLDMNLVGTLNRAHFFFSVGNLRLASSISINFKTCHKLRDLNCDMIADEFSDLLVANFVVFCSPSHWLYAIRLGEEQKRHIFSCRYFVAANCP